ncbi:MAG: PAS domain-containing protein, partial [Solirubrobacteraceae bacterium]
MTVVDSEAIRVLLVDDDEDDRLIIGAMLADQERVRFVVDWCRTYDEALRTMSEQRHDVYLIDYRLGERTGLELVREGFALRPLAPVIMVTGLPTYEIDLEASALGVAGFVVKQDLDPAGLERSIRYAISLQKAERYARALRGAEDGIWDWDLASDRVYFSTRWRAILGEQEHTQDELSSAWLDRVHGDDLPRLKSAIATHLDGKTSHLECDHRLRHTDGTWRWVTVRGLAIRRP